MVKYYLGSNLVDQHYYPALRSKILFNFFCHQPESGVHGQELKSFQLWSECCHIGVGRSLTVGWWDKFSKHHPELALRTPATLSMSRASATTKDCIDGYFDVFEKVLDDNGLHDQPSLIFNMDETGFPLDPKPMKTVHERGEKNPISVSSGSKSRVTVVACVSATGQTIPPLIIWKRKTMSPDMAIGEVPGTQYGFSDSGWMQAKLFDSWFRKHFMRYAPASRPLLLLLDGHSSHYCPDTINLAAENGIIIFTLPPNTTHLTQPLDKGIFGPFKMHWKIFKLAIQGK